VSPTFAFAREHLRAPLVLVLLVALPALFVVLAASVLSEFADALGGSLIADAASALGAGWSAAFITGALGYFQAASSRGTDRRLALASLGVRRVAAARIGASLILALIAAATAFVALALETGIAHPWHAAAAILGFALIYLGVGTVVGALIASPLEGSLAVAFIFILDVFSGPGMTEGDGSPLSISRSAADVLIAAAVGGGSPARDWLELALWVAGALIVAFGVFVYSARSRL
jgi:hypothetical protein